jgi:hypothetical protein
MDGGLRMKRMAILAGLAVLAFSAAGPAHAQMGMGMSGPSMKGLWNPVVGAGAVYEMTGRDGKKMQMEWAIVGKESVNGQDGYWMEMTVNSERGTMVTKTLVVPQGTDTTISRTIIQPPGQDPMELPAGMVQHRAHQAPSDIRKEGKDMGKETVTTPAGTFSTEHWQSNDGSDVWVSSDISPLGVVKTASKDGGTMTLVKLDKNVTDKITGTPKPFNPMGMMGGRPPQMPPQPPPQAPPQQ